jgi:hypothetical protein
MRLAKDGQKNNRDENDYEDEIGISSQEMIEQARLRREIKMGLNNNKRKREGGDETNNTTTIQNKTPENNTKTPENNTKTMRNSEPTSQAINITTKRPDKTTTQPKQYNKCKTKQNKYNINKITQYYSFKTKTNNTSKQNNTTTHSSNTTPTPQFDKISTQHCHQQNKTSQINNPKQNKTKPSSDQQKRDFSKQKHYNASPTILSSEPNKEMTTNENETGKTMHYEQNNITNSFLTLSDPGASQLLTHPSTNKQNTSIEIANSALFPAKNSRYNPEQRTKQKQYTSGEKMSVVLKRAKKAETSPPGE